MAYSNIWIGSTGSFFSQISTLTVEDNTKLLTNDTVQNSFRTGVLFFCRTGGLLYALFRESVAVPDGFFIIGANPAIGGNFVLIATSAGVVGGQSFTIAIPISGAAGAGTHDSTALIPANAVVFDALVVIDTPFDGAATLQVGRANPLSAALLQGAADNNPALANMYDVPQATLWGAADSTVRVTVAGAPTVGAARIYVTYANPLV